jgi:hypothetical protein
MSSHDISLTVAAAKTLNFQNAYTSAIKGGKFPKDDISEILNQSGCVGLRYYFALDNSSSPNSIHVVLCGVDSSGNDMIATGAKLKDQAWPCPPHCGTSNELNHVTGS